VLATDLVDQWFDPGDGDVEVRRHDIVRDPAPEAKFDLVHARFVLEHVADPRAAMARLVEALRPGGALMLEDSAGLELAITPSAPVFDRLTAAWERAGRAVGWNAAYGSDLLSQMRMTGLVDLQGRQHRQLAPGGERWAHVARGIQRPQPQLIEQGITHDHLREALRCLADSNKLITGPPITIAWGRRPD
jgi:SAM-dependent methyltransferase